MPSGADIVDHLIEVIDRLVDVLVWYGPEDPKRCGLLSRRVDEEDGFLGAIGPKKLLPTSAGRNFGVEREHDEAASLLRQQRRLIDDEPKRGTTPGDLLSMHFLPPDTFFMLPA